MPEYCESRLKYGDCNQYHVTIFSSGSANDISDLLYYRDIPVVIDGYESENLYRSLLRNVVNVPRKNKKLDTSDRLNVLPIFVCPNIKSTFKNVFSIDLTALDIDNDYLNLIEENRQMLASWTYELITDVKEYIKQPDNTFYDTHRIPESERSSFDHFHEHIKNLRVKCQSTTNLTVFDIKNIGYRVFINILPDAEYKNERYVFTVRLMRGTHTDDISRYVDEVRRLLGLGFSSPIISTNSIKLLASKKPLHENSLSDMLESPMFKSSNMAIPYAVGYDIMGEMVFADITEFPHLLMGGTSGSGKSSALHSLLMSIVCKQSVDKVKLLLLDFGDSGLDMFDKTPHIMCPTIRNAEKGLQHLQKLQDEVKRRESIDSNHGRCPYIICVIDEFFEFFRQLTQGKDSKKSLKLIEGLLAKARKVKIHLILSTQDASKDTIGISTANLGARIAFRCTDRYKSQAIIGTNDAANLSGKGSLYFKCSEHEGLKRLQGSFMERTEIKNILDNMTYIPSTGKYEEVPFELELTSDHTETHLATSPENNDELTMIEIVKWVVDNKKEELPNNNLKIDWHMGYTRAKRFLERLEKEGIVSPPLRGTNPRTVNLDKAEAFLNALTPVDDEGELPQALEQEADVEPIQEAAFSDIAAPIADGVEMDSSQVLEQVVDTASIQVDTPSEATKPKADNSTRELMELITKLVKENPDRHRFKVKNKKTIRKKKTLKEPLPDNEQSKH